MGVILEMIIKLATVLASFNNYKQRDPPSDYMLLNKSDHGDRNHTKIRETFVCLFVCPRFSPRLGNGLPPNLMAKSYGPGTCHDGARFLISLIIIEILA